MFTQRTTYFVSNTKLCRASDDTTSSFTECPLLFAWKWSQEISVYDLKAPKISSVLMTGQSSVCSWGRVCCPRRKSQTVTWVDNWSRTYLQRTFRSTLWEIGFKYSCATTYQFVKDNCSLTLLLNGRHDLWKLNLGLLYTCYCNNDPI